MLWQQALHAAHARDICIPTCASQLLYPTLEVPRMLKETLRLYYTTTCHTSRAVHFALVSLSSTIVQFTPSVFEKPRASLSCSLHLALLVWCASTGPAAHVDGNTVESDLVDRSLAVPPPLTLAEYTASQ